MRKRPTRDEVMMEIAESMATRSTCNKNQGVGVVITVDGRVASTGYNGAPAGLPHCNHRCSCRIESPIGVLHEDTCELRIPCENAVHGECNAIAYAAKHGVSLEGGWLYTTFSPCLSCAQLIINAGITRVVFAADFRDKRGLDVLQRTTKIEVVRFGT